MFKVLGIMAAATAAGYLLRRHSAVRRCAGLVRYVIWALLFLLGVSVGADEALVKGLGDVGLKALVMALACLLGAMTAAWAVYRVFFRKEGR